MFRIIKQFNFPPASRVADVMWKRRLFGWILVFGFGSLYCYWAYRLPTPGKAVAALAVVAAVMQFLGEIGGLEKLGWMALLFAFLLMETKAIDLDRVKYTQDQQKTRAEEIANFSKIGEGIQDSIKQGANQFDMTMSRARDNFNQMTGGDSYPMVNVVFIPLTTANSFKLALSVVGTNPLFDVAVIENQLPLPKITNLAEKFEKGSVPAFSAASLSPHRVELLPAITLSPEGQSNVAITTIARNGTFIEYLHVKTSGNLEKKKNGLVLPWEQSFEIFRQGNNGKLTLVKKEGWEKTYLQGAVVRNTSP